MTQVWFGDTSLSANFLAGTLAGAAQASAAGRKGGAAEDGHCSRAEEERRSLPTPHVCNHYCTVQTAEMWQEMHHLQPAHFTAIFNAINNHLKNPTHS